MNDDIVLCDECNGTGVKERSELVDYHNCIRKEWFADCSACNGTGRLIKVISYKPYVPEETGKND